MVSRTVIEGRNTATGGTLLPAPKDAPQFYLGEAKDAHVWLLYEPSLPFLKSPDCALTLSRAKGFVDWGKIYDKSGSSPRGISAGSSYNNSNQPLSKRHLVFAPAKYLSNKQLLELGGLLKDAGISLRGEGQRVVELLGIESCGVEPNIT